MKNKRYIKGIMKNRISKLLLIAAAAVLSGLLSGCAVIDPDTSMLAPHKWDEIYKNRENLNKLRVKMTKDEVLQIMGEPIQGEAFCEDNVWWYYTRTCWTDYVTTRDECTPVVFDKEEKVEGFGTTYFRTHYDYMSWSDKTVKKVLE